MRYGRTWPLHEVICNTSPLQYLFQIDLLEVLREQFDQVLVPEAVAAELDEGRRRNVPLPKLEDLDWVTITSTHDGLPSPVRGLGKGERAVLALGAHMPQAVLLLDDMRARSYATRHGMNTTGTLGMVLLAKERAMIPSVAAVLSRLERYGFRLSDRTRHAALELAREVAE
jgi:predicted nucleic acid-binding protein